MASYTKLAISISGARAFHGSVAPLLSHHTAMVHNKYADTGPFGLAEIRDSSVDALFAFYQDWNILRVRIRDPAPMLALSATCFSEGLMYHTHQKWNEALGTYAIGPNSCGPPNTGGHYDPTLACSVDTANPYCSNVPPSSANPNANGNYVCDPSQYQQNPYTCEVGDLSGKYGMLPFNITSAERKFPLSVALTDPAQQIDIMGINVTLGEMLKAAGGDMETETAGSGPAYIMHAPATFGPDITPLGQSIQVSNGHNFIFRVNHDPYSPLITLLRGKSVVLHCTNKARIACAKIQYQDSVRFDVARDEILARIGRKLKRIQAEDAVAGANVELPTSDALKRSLGSTVAKATSIANSVVEHFTTWLQPPLSFPEVV